MKRYIRTKDGKIIDTNEKHYITDNNKLILCHEYETHGGLEPDENGFICDICVIEKHTECKYIGEILKQANIIGKLIEVGDLVKTTTGRTDTVVKIEKGGLLVLTCGDMVFSDYITELYTKQGNNYILVARKENGEWRVI